MSDSQSHDRHDARGLTRSLVLVVAGVVIALGVAAAVVPDIVIATGRDMVSPAGLYAAAAFRGGSGLVLLLAARESRAPGILRAIGINDLSSFSGWSQNDPRYQDAIIKVHNAALKYGKYYGNAGAQYLNGYTVTAGTRMVQNGPARDGWTSRAAAAGARQVRRPRPAAAATTCSSPSRSPSLGCPVASSPVERHPSPRGRGQ